MSTTLNHSDGSKRPRWKRSTLTAFTLSLLFLVIYNSTNWITSQRVGVGTWYYEWERFLPFVPWMIIPYMSIDIFFVAAPFVCSTVNEQRLFSRRIAFVILTTGICFLLFPLQLAVERPYVEGWLGTIFNSFREVDLPYNLCPSLHIGLRTILAEFYSRHTKGRTRITLHVWFSLVGVSTLLTYQHHLVDVIGGFILGIITLFLIRETPLKMPSKKNYRIGLYYSVTSAVMIALAVTFNPWGLLLLWPAMATGIVGGGYFFFGPGVFGKFDDGNLPLSTRLILAPVLLGQYLSLHYYRRHCHAWNRVTDSVWIGRILTNEEATHAINEGVTAVVDLTVNFSEARPFRDIEYLHLPVLDLTAPNADQIDAAVSFIATESRQGIVYIHCKIGYSRSAVIIGAYLISSGIASDADDAISRLRQVRPSIVMRPEAEEAIQEYVPKIQSGKKR